MLSFSRIWRSHAKIMNCWVLTYRFTKTNYVTTHKQKVDIHVQSNLPFKIIKLLQTLQQVLNNDGERLCTAETGADRRHQLLQAGAGEVAVALPRPAFRQVVLRVEQEIQIWCWGPQRTWEQDCQIFWTHQLHEWNENTLNTHTHTHNRRFNWKKTWKWMTLLVCAKKLC